MRPSFLLPLVLLLGCPPVPDSDPGKDTAPKGPADVDNDGFDIESDCDDDDAAVHPGADELCNEIDDDCDGVVDDAPVDESTWYADSDGDGFGDASTFQRSCSQPAGLVADATDCNDASADYHPGAPETGCTGPDYNCNGAYDEGDGDSDGYMACDDCDDTRAEVSPEGVEACDGLDNDCNGTIDDGAGGSQTYYLDADGDLYGDRAEPVEACALPPGYSETGNDCDDDDATIHPGADETCNGIDDDCDDDRDENPIDPDTFYADGDNDGYGSSAVTAAACDAPAGYVAASGDCNDRNASINPAALEYCGGTDWDCDGAVNEADSVDIASYYEDTDGDGYYGTYAGAACTAPSGTSFSSTDCDESDATINPAADDVCNDVDDDCDGATDDGNRVPEDYASIQSAVLAASAGERVCVAGGTYYEDVDFSGHSVILEGEDGSGSTTIKGTATGSVITIASGEAAPELRGFTITNGDAAYGAGLYLYGSPAVLDDLVITGNSCTDTYCYGVGAYVYYADVQATDVEISDNAAVPAVTSSTTYYYTSGVGLMYAGSYGTWDGLTVSGNYAYYSGLSSSSQYGYAYGVGMYLSSDHSTMENIVVSDNYAYRGSSTYGYIYSYGTGVYANSGDSTFDGLEISGNYAYLYGTYDYITGAGLYSYYDTCDYNHLDIRGNTADAYSINGVGAYIGYNSTPTITNAVIAGNKGTYSVSGYNYIQGVGFVAGQNAIPVLTNVDIYGNKGTADYVYGAGIYLDYYGGIDATNIAVCSNTAAYSSSGGGGAVYLYSSSYSSGYSFAYSNFYGNSSSEFTNLSTVVGSSGNIAVTPGYTSVVSSDPTAWDLTLTASSSMKNAGDATITDTDGTRSDIGSQGGPGGGW